MQTDVRATVTALTQSARSFTDTATVSQFLSELDAGSFRPTPNFLLSFPRSGNGYVRLLLARAMLLSHGLDPAEAVLEVYDHTNDGVQAQRFNFEEKGMEVSVETIVPDMYANPSSRLLNFDDAFQFGSTKLIKTHHAVPRDTANYLYLYRDPKTCCTSYFHLVNWWQAANLEETDEIRPIFTEVVREFLEVYSFLAREALAAERSGQCHLVSLERIVDGDLSQLDRWLRWRQVDNEEALLERAGELSGFYSVFDQGLFSIWSAELDHALKEADGLFQELNARPTC